MRKGLIALLFMILFFSYTHAQNIVLTEQKVTNQFKSQVCELMKEVCKDEFQLYNDPLYLNQYYVIYNLKILQIEQLTKKIKIKNSWDFSNYIPQKVSTFWTTEEGIDTPSDVKRLYPVLFQLSEETYAIALIQEFREYYSGGGMSEVKADFFELLPEHQYRLKFQNIPFSVYRMIRACFSEEDYEKSGEHCHDEENLVLNIKYMKPDTWQMKYHYYRDLSPVSDQKSLNQRKNYIIHSLQDEINFPKSWAVY